MLVGSKNCQGCLYLVADGRITSSSPAMLEQFIENNILNTDKDVTMIFNSPGGSLMAGLEIGEIIRSNGFNSHIAMIEYVSDGNYVFKPGECASACGYAFLGGYKRSVELLSKYGLHQISTMTTASVALADAVSETQNVIAQISQYVDRMGVSQHIVSIATRTPSQSIYWLNNAELSESRVINSRGINAQSPWVSRSADYWTTNYVLKDGGTDNLQLSCLYLIRGKVQLIFSHQRLLPYDHPYSRSGILRLPVEFFYEGRKVLQEKADFMFSSKSHMATIDLPFSLITESIIANSVLSFKVNYPASFPSFMSDLEHQIPLEGLNEAAKAMVYGCPHLKI